MEHIHINIILAIYFCTMIYLLKRKSILYRPGLWVGALAITGMALNSEFVTGILTAMRAV